MISAITFICVLVLNPYQRDSEEEETHDEVTVIEGEEVKNQAETDGLTVIVPISESEYTITKENVGQEVDSSSSERKDLTKSSKSTEEEKEIHNSASDDAKEERDEFNEIFKYTFIPNETKNISELKSKLKEAFKSEYYSCLQRILNPNPESPEHIDEVLKICLQNIWEQFKECISEIKIISTEKHLDSDSSNNKEFIINKRLRTVSVRNKNNKLLDDTRVDSKGTDNLNSLDALKRLLNGDKENTDKIDIRNVKINKQESRDALRKALLHDKGARKITNKTCGYEEYIDRYGRRFVPIYEPEETLKINSTRDAIKSLLSFPGILFFFDLRDFYSKLIFLNDKSKQTIQDLQDKSIEEYFKIICNFLNSKLPFIMKTIWGESKNNNDEESKFKYVPKAVDEEENEKIDESEGLLISGKQNTDLFYTAKGASAILASSNCDQNNLKSGSGANFDYEDIMNEIKFEDLISKITPLFINTI